MTGERCSCCHRQAHVLMRPTRHRRDNVLLTCDTCLEPVCRRCAEVDEDGRCTCEDCLQTEALAAVA